MVTERTLGTNGSMNATTIHRTEYFASDGRERIEDTNSSGQVYLVQIISPMKQTVTSLNMANQTYTTRHAPVGSQMMLKQHNLTGPATPPTQSIALGSQTIGGLACDGHSWIVGGVYNEAWMCKGASDLGGVVKRAANGAGWEQHLQQITSSVEIPANSFAIPTGFTTVQAPATQAP